MPNISQKIFIDSSFLIAFVDRADTNHVKSMAIFEYLGRNQYQVYTAVSIIIQAFNRLERDVGSIVALEFLQAILESNVQILQITKNELLGTFRQLKANPGKQPSLIEGITAVLMHRNDVSSILTFDSWHNLMGTKVSSLLNP